MKQANELVSYLPMLRRFARLLVGNQRGGDVLVLAMLQRLAENRDEVSDVIDRQTGLYRTMLRIWKSPVGSHLSETLSARELESQFEPSARNLSMLSRAVFLLRNLEEFARDKVQLVLEMSDSEFEQIEGLANDEVSRLLSTDVMIIEDELLIAFELEGILLSLGHSVTTVVRTAKQAIKAAALQAPKLILSDIQLADGSSGIDAVNQIVKVQYAPVIFITAYPERLLTGLRPEPTYLISKPFKVEQVKAVVSQALFFDSKLRHNVSAKQLSEALVQEWPLH